MMSVAQLDENPMMPWESLDDFYSETDIFIKEELAYEDSESQTGCDSGSESPHTLTNLNNVGCITGDENALLTSDDSGFADRYSYWNNSADPTSWDNWQVQNWLNRFNSINPNFADLNGEALSQMNLEDFMHRDSTNGGMLYYEFQQLLYPQIPQMYSYVPQNNYHPNFPTDIEGEKLDSFGELLKAYSIDGTEPLPSLPAVDSSVADDKPKVKQESTSYDEKISPPPSPGGSDISSASSSKPGGRRNSRGKGKLWEFIRDLLLNSETCPSIIKWENRSEGIFRIVKSDEVAKRWGKRKCNKSMTYEKMSRAMRYYYKKGVLERIECRRLVYKFGSSSRGWQL